MDNNPYFRRPPATATLAALDAIRHASDMTLTVDQVEDVLRTRPHFKHMDPAYRRRSAVNLLEYVTEVGF